MDLKQAVAQTIAYSGYFKFPLTPTEVHHWLVSSQVVSLSRLKKYLSAISPQDKIFREKLRQNTQIKINLANNFVAQARFLPGIRLIALTGSVAANNTQNQDDIDLLIITAPNCLWFVRPLVLFLLSLNFHRRTPGDNFHQTKNAFCPNLWLDTQALSLPRSRRNLYTAHEVLQIKPLLDRQGTYLRFIKANRWTSHYLANAYQSVSNGTTKKEHQKIFSAFLFPLNFVFFVSQYLYMLPKKTTETVTLHSAFFHKNNPSASITAYLRHNSL